MVKIESNKMKTCIHESLQATLDVIGLMESVCGDAIAEAAVKIIERLEGGGKLLICGNGGSAADSQHLAAEFVVRFQKDRRGFPAVALTTDTSILTAGGNDYGFRHVFARQVEALGSEGDVFWGLSTSGTSENVILALDKAREKGLFCIVMTGETQGPLTDNADLVIQIPSRITARVQEGHITAGHLICDLVEQSLILENH